MPRKNENRTSSANKNRSARNKRGTLASVQILAPRDQDYDQMRQRLYARVVVIDAPPAAQREVFAHTYAGHVELPLDEGLLDELDQVGTSTTYAKWINLVKDGNGDYRIAARGTYFYDADNPYTAPPIEEHSGD